MNSSQTSALVDGVLRVAIFSGVVSVAMFSPPAIKAIDKPLYMALNKLDERSRKREVQKLLRYMKYQGMLVGDYEFGMQITSRGRRRLHGQAARLENSIPRPSNVWDHTWRIVVYDIPERSKSNRERFARGLAKMGFIKLQRSVWVHPYPCKDQVALCALELKIAQYITFFESPYIDNEKELINRFKSLKTM